MKDLSDKIYLVGMPGSGKSTIGAELSVVLGYHFYDLDVEIEIAEGLTVAEIFKKRGAEDFRKSERNNLVELTNKRKSFLMSTGGGTPCYHDNMDFMNENGVTVFINSDIDKIVERVLKQEEKRPMFSKLTLEEIKNKMYALYEVRQGFYSQSQITIEDKDINVRKITHKLLDAFE